MKSLLSLPDSDVQVWPSYTDVAMNVILILLLYLFTQVVFASQSMPCQQEIRQRMIAMRQVVEKAIPASLRANVTITEDGNLQRFTFADRVLFDSGQAALKPSGIEILRTIGEVFKTRVGSFSQIQIEGHTDDRPIQVGFPSNWELSSARATSVVRFLQDTSGLSPDLLSANGYSQYKPVDTNLTDAGRARNRRIEIVLVYSTAKICGSAATPASVPKPN
jgi:chemotaxis protein MotB